jgi:uncharacterized coiled-coil DUF342 family protein
MTAESLAPWIPVITSLIGVGVGYGIFASDIKALKKDNERADSRMTAIEASHMTMRSEIQKIYVTYRQFEQFADEMRKERDEMKADVKQLLQMVAGLAAKFERSGN